MNTQISAKVVIQHFIVKPVKIPFLVRLVKMVIFYMRVYA